MSSAYGLPVKPTEWFVRESAPSWAYGSPPQDKVEDREWNRQPTEPSQWWTDTLGSLMAPQTSLVWKQLADIASIVNEFPPDDHKAVLGFLIEHPVLPEFIGKSARCVWELFGVGARLTLHLMRDPEEGFEELFLVVNADRELEEASDLLNKFDDWFIKLPFSVRKDFCVTLR